MIKVVAHQLDDTDLSKEVWWIQAEHATPERGVKMTAARDHRAVCKKVIYYLKLSEISAAKWEEKWCIFQLTVI